MQPFPGAEEVAVVCAIILLLFGGSRIPEIARNLGRAKREFRKGLEEDEDEDEKRR